MAEGIGAWYARQTIELVNRERARRGLPRLAEDRTLNQVAVGHCLDMVNRGYYDHISPQGIDVAGRVAARGYLATMTAENIARGQKTPVEVVAGWMASPGHRANSLHPDLRAIGAGYAYSARDDYHHYWTHVFATPDPSVGRDRSRF
ncbi:MAG: CAP domain-containing protein, partial [Caldilineaceae bacterium]|nr:CAP domain-containing protein [Caldilineaceae bacterium]